MGGKFRPAVMAATAFALLAMASPVAVLAGPLAAHDVLAATSDAKHPTKGSDHDARNAPATAAPTRAPSADGEAATASRDATVQPSEPRPAVTGTAVANGAGSRPLPVQIALSKPRAGQPSERADHASANSRGLHFGAGDDRDETAATSPATNPPASTVPSGTPSAGTQAASAPAVVRTSTSQSGGTSTPSPVIIEPPAAPQPNPPLGTQPALTGARLDWILVAVVIALAASVVAAVRVATLRGRRPPR